MKFNFPKDRIFPDEARWQLIKAWVRGIFLEDWAMKLIALAIALVLWFGISGQRSQITRRFSNITLNFQYPTGLDKSNNPRETVEIIVSGDKRKVENLAAQGLTVSFDLSNYKAGEYAVPLNPETVNLELPSGVKLEEIEPNIVQLILERREEKLVEVKPEFIGELPEGLEIYETSVMPNKVRVRGTTGQLESLKIVPTEKINLENHAENFVEKQTAIDLPNPKITVLDALVDVTVKIGEQRVEKSYGGIVVKTDDGAKVSPSTAIVTLYGARSILMNLRPEDIQIRLETVDGTLKPTLVLPENAAGKIEMRLLRPNSFSIR